MRRLTSRRRRRWLWRWRSNPLRRRDDVVETWIVLAMWVVIGLGGTLVGVVTAQAAEASFAQLRHDRHSARVVLVENTTRAVQTGKAPPTAMFGRRSGGRRRTVPFGPAEPRWTPAATPVHASQCGWTATDSSPRSRRPRRRPPSRRARSARERHSPSAVLSSPRGASHSGDSTSGATTGGVASGSRSGLDGDAGRHDTGLVDRRVQPTPGA